MFHGLRSPREHIEIAVVTLVDWPEVAIESMIPSNRFEPWLVECSFRANLSGGLSCLGFKASVVVERGAIRFPHYVPQQEVSDVYLAAPRLF